jgi:hypothetical protein
MLCWSVEFVCAGIIRAALSAARESGRCWADKNMTMERVLVTFPPSKSTLLREKGSKTGR